MDITSNTSITPKVIPPPFINNVNLQPLQPRVRPPPLNLKFLTHTCYTYESPYIENEQTEIALIRNIDEAIESRLFNFICMQSIAKKSAIEMHNKWRNEHIQQNGDGPYIKKTKDGVEVDINVDGNQLESEFLEFNYNIAMFVATCINIYHLKNIEYNSTIIHRKLLMMNPLAKGGPLDVPYAKLPEIDKEKNRDIYWIVHNYYFKLPL
jgi:hypothetical protein